MLLNECARGFDGRAKALGDLSVCEMFDCHDRMVAWQMVGLTATPRTAVGP